MFKMKLLIILLASAVISAYDYYPAVGYYYKFYEVPLNWNRARITCEIDNATLAVPKTTNELDIIVSIFRSRIQVSDKWVDRIFWLGYHDFFEEGKFIGVNDHQAIPNALRWITGEPENEAVSKIIQDCATVGKTGELYDAPCEWDLRYFCQKGPKSKNTDEEDSSQFPKNYNLFYALWPKNMSPKRLFDATENA